MIISLLSVVAESGRVSTCAGFCLEVLAQAFLLFILRPDLFARRTFIAAARGPAVSSDAASTGELSVTTGSANAVAALLPRPIRLLPLFLTILLDILLKKEEKI